MAKLTQDALRARMEHTGGDGLPIVRIKKDKTLSVRFLTEPAEWSYYDEYYDAEDRKSYVIHPGQMAPANMRVTTRYLANVLVVDDDKVMALTLPSSLAQRIYNRWSKSKSETICDRDYELLRMGEGLNTTYMESPEAPSQRPVGKYELLDLEDVISRMNQAPGSPHMGTSPAPPVEVEDESDLYEDEDKPAQRVAGGSPPDLLPNEEPFPEPDVAEDSEAFPDEEEEDGDPDYWTVKELLALDLAELHEVAVEAGIEDPAEYGKKELAEMLGQ